MGKHKPALDHAKHNEEACRELLRTGKFNDWVITTAYYSAIYYVTYELFPAQYEVGGKALNCLNFQDYYFKLSHLIQRIPNIR